MKRDFWKSSGRHLVEVNEQGWLSITADYLRAYYTRPEIHPVESSCANEHQIFEKLMVDPFAEVSSHDLDQIADADAADNYRFILRFRDHLVQHGSIEGAYIGLFKKDVINIPPIFIDQMVHMILAHILCEVEDPMQLRAAELFFREQAVTIDDEQLMLADREIVEMKSESGFGGLGQLLTEAGTPMRDVSLDIMTDENKDVYWDRSDKFDMAADFRFTQPVQDAFGRVLEAWLFHFLKLRVHATALKSIRDEKWTWHIGCDLESTRILNALYNSDPVSDGALGRILALFRLEILDQGSVLDNMQGKPVYLGLAMNAQNKLIMKPQNLLLNMPTRQS